MVSGVSKRVSLVTAQAQLPFEWTDWRCTDDRRQSGDARYRARVLADHRRCYAHPGCVPTGEFSAAHAAGVAMAAAALAAWHLHHAGLDPRRLGSARPDGNPSPVVRTRPD